GPGRRTPRAACGWPAPGRRGRGCRAPGAGPAGASSYFQHYRNMKLLSRPAGPLELGDRPLVLDVPGVERAGGREQQHVDLVAEGPRTVFDALGHDDQLARADLPIAVPELHAQAPVHDEEQFVLAIVVMPHELTPELDHLDVHGVDLTHDPGRPGVAELPELFGQAHDLHGAPSSARGRRHRLEPGLESRADLVAHAPKHVQPIPAGPPRLRELAAAPAQTGGPLREDRAALVG